MISHIIPVLVMIGSIIMSLKAKSDSEEILAALYFIIGMLMFILSKM